MVRGCTTHCLRFYRPRADDCRATRHAPRRPRHLSGPSYRPTQQGGCTSAVRQCVPGAGEGPHTATVCGCRRVSRSGSRRPIQRAGAGYRASGRMGVRRRREPAGPSPVSPGASSGAPVRPQARPLPALHRGGTSPARTLARVCARTVRAFPVPCCCARWRRACCPAGCSRRKRTAASEKAHVREACPIGGPAGP
jgi:hypothetical protein